MIRTFFAAILCCVISVTKPIQAAAQQPSPAYKQLATEVLQLVNEHRAQIGMKPLKMADAISVAAEQHSKNMAAGRIPFGHDGFDARMKKVTQQVKPANAWAENVAYSSNDAKDVVDMWLHSPGHKKNIEGGYNFTGIGIAKGRDGQYYYTQIFINKGD